jgi:hypothetical protein
LTYRTYLHNAELQEHVERQVREALLAEAPAPIQSTPLDVGVAYRAAALGTLGGGRTRAQSGRVRACESGATGARAQAERRTDRVSDVGRGRAPVSVQTWQKRARVPVQARQRRTGRDCSRRRARCRRGNRRQS